MNIIPFLELQAKVVWSVPADREVHKNQIGVRFVNLTEEQISVIKQLIQVKDEVIKEE